MNKIIMIFVVLTTLLAACAPSQDAVQTAIAQTKIAQPTDTPTPQTPTPTPIPIKDLDYEPILSQSGDLPPGLSFAQVIKDFKLPEKSPAVIAQLKISFAKNNKNAGAVSFYLYESQSDAENVYELISKSTANIKYENVPDLGESAASTSAYVPLIGGSSIKFASVVFRICKAVIDIEFSEDLDKTGAINYAKRLEDRLKKVICNP